ncbi:phosphopantetheine--protein transferase domain-containing protein [Aliiruegeria lutimaris]|uniref:Phosphopantetheine--protein transferase domain-containing protein n=2 Tax=Aliiruegeria lutimaris TaxID=571298 RepID=A0A1G9HTG8_9RHOB|nr:phosphopantetheine--protein transferase domain-containing protein [Aliiruegeria lutimaris]
MAACAKSCRIIAIAPRATFTSKKTENGKPFLRDGPEFSLSHSSGWATLAVDDVQVGVDIERVRPVKPGIAEWFLSPAELVALNAQPQKQRGIGFYRCWTGKEAFVKATGTRITIPLDAFDVSLVSDLAGYRVPTRLPGLTGQDWQLTRLHLAADFPCAVATRGDCACARPGSHRLITFCLEIRVLEPFAFQKVWKSSRIPKGLPPESPAKMSNQDYDPPGAAGRGIANAGLWAVGGKLASRVFDLATLIILTAILEPADFGLVAKAMTVVVLVEVITMVPIDTPILRIKTPSSSLYDTAFTLNLIRAGVIAVLIVGLSQPLSVYFKDSRLASLMWWLSLGPALRACVSPKLAEFTRVFDMRPEALMDVVSKVTSLLVVTFVAIATRSYWAIAVGTVTTTFVLNVLSYILAPYRPRLSLRHWLDYKDVVTWVTLSQSLQAMNWQLDNLILGRMLGNDLFGRYAIAKQLNDIPFQALAVPLTRPMIAAFSAATDDKSLRRLWLSYSNGVLFTVGAILVTLAILAEDVIFVLLGPGWTDSSHYLTALALATLPALPIVPLNPFAVATFRSRLVALRILLQFLFSVPALIAGAMLAGVMGTILAKALVECAMLIFAAQVLRSELGLPLRRQFLSYWRSLLGFAALCLLLLLLRDLGAGLTDGSRILTALRLIAISIPCLLGYVGTCLALWRVAGRPAGPEAFLWRKIKPEAADA